MRRGGRGESHQRPQRAAAGPQTGAAVRHLAACSTASTLSSRSPPVLPPAALQQRPACFLTPAMHSHTPQVALRDLAHPRPSCANHAFRQQTSTSNAQRCAQVGAHGWQQREGRVARPLQLLLRHGHCLGHRGSMCVRRMSLIAAGCCTCSKHTAGGCCVAAGGNIGGNQEKTIRHAPREQFRSSRPGLSLWNYSRGARLMVQKPYPQSHYGGCCGRAPSPRSPLRSLVCLPACHAPFAVCSASALFVTSTPQSASTGAQVRPVGGQRLPAASPAHAQRERWKPPTPPAHAARLPASPTHTTTPDMHQPPRTSTGARNRDHCNAHSSHYWLTLRKVARAKGAAAAETLQAEFDSSATVLSTSFTAPAHKRTSSVRRQTALGLQDSCVCVHAPRCTTRPSYVAARPAPRQIILCCADVAAPCC